MATLYEAVIRNEIARLWRERGQTSSIVVYLRTNTVSIVSVGDDGAIGRDNFVRYEPVDLLMSIAEFSARFLVPLVDSIATPLPRLGEHPLRNLARQIEALVKEHEAYSQAQPVVQNCVDHLSAIAKKTEYDQQFQLLRERGLID